MLRSSHAPMRITMLISTSAVTVSIVQACALIVRRICVPFGLDFSQSQ